MKRPIITLFCFCILPLFLYGCSDHIQPATENNPPPLPTTTTALTQTNAAAIKNKDYEEIGSALCSDEKLYILNNDSAAKNVIEIFGEPDSKSEAIIWGADGLEHQSWLYDKKGIKFDLIKDDKNAQFVASIDISSPCDLKTSKGIGIGSSKEDVMKAYEYEIDPESLSSGTESIVAGTVYGGLIFSIEGNKVSHIFIGAAAE